MAFIESGANPADQLTVDALSKAARVALYGADGAAAIRAEQAQVVGNGTGVAMLGKNDNALMLPRMDRFGSLASALHNPLFTESFEATVINLVRWTASVNTMTAGQGSVSGLTLNSGLINTASTGVMITSARRFLKMQRSPLQMKFRARFVHVNNAVFEVGFGDPATFNGVVQTGCYFQTTSTGVIQPVITFNGIDVTGTDIRPLINIANYYVFDICIDDENVIFTVQDGSTGSLINRQVLTLASSAQRLFSSTGLQVLIREYVTSTATATPASLVVTDVYVGSLDADLARPVGHVYAAMDRGFTSQPFNGLQLSQWTNSAEPANAVLSNTAASYTNLGGKFQFSAVAGAVTDFCLFGFQVPTPANFVITGIDIDSWNTGAAVATTATVLNWGIAVGATAVSLANAQVMRVGIGSQSFLVGAAIGASANRLSKQFQTPLHCGSGRFVQVIIRMPIGTATAAQVIAGMVNIEGYFD
jgi:hypothetical protein